MGNDKPRHTGGGRQRSNRGGQNRDDRNRNRDTRGGDNRGGIDQPRKVALKVLADVREKDAYANLLLPKLLKAHKLKGRDAAFTTELTYGCLLYTSPSPRDS